MKIDWRLLLDDHPHNGRIMLPDWVGEKVYVNLETRDSIFKQLQDLVGKRVVDLIPGDEEDWEKYSAHTNLDGPATSWTPEQHQAARKIGILTEVAMNVDNYVSPTSSIFAKVELDERWKDIQWKAYELHIGIEGEKWENGVKPIEFEPYETVDDKWTPTEAAWKNGFTIKSCIVKGVYFKKARNSNDHGFDRGLRNYYHQRSIGRFIYLPGRAYF
jgi:hypothetical protein